MFGSDSELEEGQDPAEAFIDQAWEASNPVLRALFARKALAIDPDAIDAYVALALTVETMAERIALLREAVRIGDAKWPAQVKRPPKDYFWLELDTRPYMRAIQNLALALWQRGQRAEAAGLADRLLRLNPNDNQGARYLGLSWHGALEHWPRVETLLRQCEGESRTEYLYARCLDLFRRHGDAEEALARALGINPHVPKLLLGKARHRLRQDVMAVAYRSLDEAVMYAEHNREAWQAVPGALKWLRKAVKHGPHGTRMTPWVVSSAEVLEPRTGHGYCGGGCPRPTCRRVKERHRDRRSDIRPPSRSVRNRRTPARPEGNGLMALFALTQPNIDFIKHSLRSGYPDIKSSHLSEAIAAACGYHTNIAMVTALRGNQGLRPALMEVGDDRFTGRLRALGYSVVNGEVLPGLARSPQLPDRIWYVAKAGNIPAKNLWFRECERRDMPYIYVTPRRKYAQVDWDHMSYHPKHDNVVGSRGFNVGETMFKRFQEIARGAPGKPTFFGSALVGNIKQVPIDLAPVLADTIYQLLYEAICEGERMAVIAADW